MTELDFQTATMKDIIARSIAMHPSLLVDSMVEISNIHRQYGQLSTGPTATSARNMAIACEEAIDFIEDGDLDALCANFSAYIQTFEQACRLQCITPATKREIAERDK